MTTVRYDADVHRLRLEGECRDYDRSSIQDALGTFAELAGGHLIVDLTAVTGIDQSIANELVDAARARTEGPTFAFVRKHGSPVDDALKAAENRDPE
jgi:anti-anti-sigma regulatory factor